MGAREAGRRPAGGCWDDGCMHWGVTVERKRGGQIRNVFWRGNWQSLLMDWMWWPTKEGNIDVAPWGSLIVMD